MCLFIRKNKEFKTKLKRAKGFIWAWKVLDLGEYNGKPILNSVFYPAHPWIPGVRTSTFDYAHRPCRTASAGIHVFLSQEDAYKNAECHSRYVAVRVKCPTSFFIGVGISYYERKCAVFSSVILPLSSYKKAIKEF